MENKKTIIGIIIVIVLIIALLVVSYLYSNYNTEQVALLTEETNKLLQSDILEDEIDFDIKTKKDYAIVEKSIKEYLAKFKNIYKELEETNNGINSENADNIFSSINIKNKNLDEINKIIDDYKEKGKELFSECEQLIKEENITKNIEEKNISKRKDYYINLYKSAMLSDSMKIQYENMQTKISRAKDDLYSKLNQLGNIKKYLEKNEKYWSIKNEKIEFTNTNIMTEYFDLVNQLDEEY